MELTEIIAGLKKRVNVSADADKTKERAEQAWKSFNNKDKRAVLALADVSAATAHKVYKDGHLSAALALALGKTANVAPLYLAGVTDAKGKFSKASLNAFLSANGYSIPEPPASETDKEEDTIVEIQAVVKDVEDVCDCEDVCECCGEPCICLDEEDMITLLKALMIRAKADPNAEDSLNQVTDLLLK